MGAKIMSSFVVLCVCFGLAQGTVIATVTYLTTFFDEVTHVQTMLRMRIRARTFAHEPMHLLRIDFDPLVLDVCLPHRISGATAGAFSSQLSQSSRYSVPTCCQRRVTSRGIR